MIRIGQGYDIHALVSGRKLIIGGVEIPHTHGLDGHSDADVLLHAITDALFGAATLGDIGKHFPDTDERSRGADSRVLLREAGQGVMLKPYQQPHPPIVVTAVVPHSKGLQAASARGWQPITANFLQPVWAATHWPMVERGCAQAGPTADRRHWRVCKSVFVADDDAAAQRYARDPNGPFGFYYWNLLAKRKSGGGSVDIFKHDLAMPDEAVTVEYLLDTLVICGSVERVVEQILAFRDTVGDFGTLLYAGHDWADPVLAPRSMELMATEVMPRVNQALGKKTGAPKAASSA